jgi:hypothetical protein
MIPEEGRLITPHTIAARVDTLLAQARPPSARNIRWALTSLEFVLPLMILKLPPFSQLSQRSRRRLLEKIVASRGRLRGLARMLKTLITFSYYTHTTVRRGIGYIDFEQRPRSAGLDITPYQYAPPRDNPDEVL